MSDGQFLLCLSGSLEYFDVLAPAGCDYHCKYEFAYGPDWKIIGGLESALSQVVTVSKNGDKVVLNFPLEVQFKSTNPHGWPQLVLSLYQENTLTGYGRLHVPIKPGCHELKVELMKPQSLSLLGYVASFFGYQPEMLQPKMLATTAGSNLIRMEYVGESFLVLNAVTQGFQSLGYDSGKN